MEEKVGFIAGILAFFAGAITVIWFNWQPASKEITAYPIECVGSERPGEKCGRDSYALSRSTYKVFIDSQRVIYQDTSEDTVPKALTNCVVRDEDNWACGYPDKSANLEMAGGKLTVIVQESLAVGNVIYVSAWRYWLLKIGVPVFLGL